MTLVSQRCPCGERLRWRAASPAGYVPLAGSVAPLRGHVAAILIEDGKERVVLPGARCTATESKSV